MGKKEQHHIFPLGHENDPIEERWPLSTLDYLSACVYNNYALFFEVEDADKPQVANNVKQGLERTLSQCRHLVSRIERNEHGNEHSFVKRKDSSVLFVVNWLDSQEDSFPSIAKLRESHYVSTAIGDISAVTIKGMTYGEKPENHPDASPIVSGFQLNFIKGGAVLVTHTHHYSNDIMGWSAFIHQLADNCRSIWNGTPSPGWDMACLDTAQFKGQEVPAEAKNDGPPPPDRNPALKPFSSLLFHLPKSKAANLKKLAGPTQDGEPWISTYDAFSAYLWRILSKLRAPLYNQDLTKPILWGEGVNMRPRWTPALPARIQGNVVFANVSTNLETQFTAGEVISEVPLSHLAAYIRRLTNATTQEALTQTLDTLEAVRDKTGLFIRLNSLPPLTIFVTDWRDSRVSDADFGFATPDVYRHLFSGSVTEGIIIVYPPRVESPDSDEGNEFIVTVEQDLVKSLIGDPDMKQFFEFRGFEVVDAEASCPKRLP